MYVTSMYVTSMYVTSMYVTSMYVTSMYVTSMYVTSMYVTSTHFSLFLSIHRSVQDILCEHAHLIQLNLWQHVHFEINFRKHNM